MVSASTLSAKVAAEVQLFLNVKAVHKQRISRSVQDWNTETNGND